MSVAFHCEQCGQTFRTDASNAGKKGRCKQCGHTFVIPGPASGPATAKSLKKLADGPRPGHARPQVNPRTRPGKPRGPDDGNVPENLYGLDDQAVESVLPRAPSPAATRTRKKPTARAMPDWGRLVDKAPKFLLLALIGLTLMLGLFAGVSQSGRTFLPTGLWWLYWGWSYAVVLGRPSWPFANTWPGASRGCSPGHSTHCSLGVLKPQGTRNHGPYAIFVLYYIFSRWRKTFAWFGLGVANVVLFGIGMAGVPELRARYVAYDKQQQAEVRQQMAGPSQRFPQITVEVAGLSDHEIVEDFSQQLITLSKGGMSSYETGATRVFQIYSDAQPQELARQITWAEVTGVEGNRIEVALREGQKRPPESDFVDACSTT